MLLPAAVDQLGEYCHFETFNASCEHLSDHVVVMTSARYGRMKFGRCMREDHGSVGCSADVLPQLDRKCSGHETCHVTIPDAALHNVHPCPRELMPYLEASYSCLPGKHCILGLSAASKRINTLFVQRSDESGYRMALIFTRESSYCFQRVLAIAILSVRPSDVTRVDQSKTV